MIIRKIQKLYSYQIPLYTKETNHSSRSPKEWPAIRGKRSAILHPVIKLSLSLSSLIQFPTPGVIPLEKEENTYTPAGGNLPFRSSLLYSLPDV